MKRSCGLVVMTSDFESEDREFNTHQDLGNLHTMILVQFITIFLFFKLF